MSRYNSRSVVAPKSSTVDLSCQHLTSMDFFRLQPIYVGEQLPGGDTFNVSVSSYIQASPLATKVFGSCHLDLHAFFVPYSLIYKDWNGYYSGDDYTQGSSQYQVPYITKADLDTVMTPGVVDTSGAIVSTPNPVNRIKRAVFGSLGYPTNSPVIPNISYNLNALYARAYQQIWWDYYRDSQNIPEKDRANYLFTSGGVTSASALFIPRYRCYKKDYITTLLKNPQLGGFSASATVNSSIPADASRGSNVFERFSSAIGNMGEFVSISGGSVTESDRITRSVSAQTLRGTIALQRYLERLGVSGTRPIERILSEFGKYPEREKLKMCDFVGSTSIPINIDGLTNTSSNSNIGAESGRNPWGINDDECFMGQQLGRGDGYRTSENWKHTANEYGCYMVIASLIPDYLRANTSDRAIFNGVGTAAADASDYFHPDFQDLGYQECLGNECFTPDLISIQNNHDWIDFDPYQVIGYQPKFEHYRHAYSKVTGDFAEYQNRNSVRNMGFIMDYSKLFDRYQHFSAGLQLTTSSKDDTAMFDNHFCVTDADYDHFICKFDIKNIATRPITNSTMPTELTHVINSGSLEVANGGVKL